MRRAQVVGRAHAHQPDHFLPAAVDAQPVHGLVLGGVQLVVPRRGDHRGDEERADEAMNAIFAAADIQEAELAEAAARAAAEEEAAAKAAAEAEAAARGIIDDTEEPEADATASVEDGTPTVPPETAPPEAAADDAPAELDTIEIGVDSSDLEELAAFAGLTGEPTVPGDADDKAK